MLRINYGVRRSNRHFINTNTMEAHGGTSGSYAAQREDNDRRIHFGNLPKESIKPEDKKE